MDRAIIKILCAVILAVSAAHSSGLGKSLRGAVGKDTVYNVWVFFNDRPSRHGVMPVSQEAKLRRLKAGYREGDADRPVDRNYIKEVERRGAAHRHSFAWENAASFSAHASSLNDIASLPFVKSVMPVGVYVRKETEDGGRRKERASRSDPGYDWHMEMVNIPLAHEYLKMKNLGEPGSGVFVAFFDTGFRLTHRALAHVRSGKTVAAAYDFVDRDTSVSVAADTVTSDTSRLYQYRSNDTHGTQCLGLVAGYHPNNYMGAAWAARFALARTEDIVGESRIEEDNWAAAVVWADSLGVSIISSSLGYKDFDSTVWNYEYKDMDGASTIVSKAAAGAAARGIIIVNAMGNEGNHPGTLIAPADVDGVVSVGAIGRPRPGETVGSIASFSSNGPTSDGRIKPEVSAPGVSIPLIDPYRDDLRSYTAGSGTSFAAPIVSGVTALILQSRPNISPADARERLYRSCRFAFGQTERDNKHGYGIPNALRAIMIGNEIFIRLTDSAGTPLYGAQITAGSDMRLTNESGCALITMPSAAQSVKLDIAFRGEILPPLTVNAAALPFDTTLALKVKRGEEGLKIFPNVVKNGGAVKGVYVFPLTSSRQADAVIRTVDGQAVWNQRLKAMPDGSASFEWNCKTAKGRKATAGVYVMTIRNGGNTVSKKFIIAN